MDGGVSELAYDIHGNIYPSDEGGCSPAGAMSRSDWGRAGAALRGCRAAVGPSQPGVFVRPSRRLSRCATRRSVGVRLSAPTRPSRDAPGGHPLQPPVRHLHGSFDLLFEKLQDPRTAAVFQRWVEMPG